MRAFILMLICFVPGALLAQTDDFHNEIMDMMILKGDEVAASLSYHDVFPKLQRNFVNNNIDSEVWQELRLDERQQVLEYITQGAMAYRQYLNRDEVADLSVFYASNTGQKYVMDKELNAQEKKELKRFLNSDVGQILSQKGDSIALALDQIKKDWTASLFKKKMRQLIKGGYLKN